MFEIKNLILKKKVTTKGVKNSTRSNQSEISESGLLINWAYKIPIQVKRNTIHKYVINFFIS